MRAAVAATSAVEIAGDQQGGGHRGHVTAPTSV
jgi:hypothetical protein